MVTPGAATVKVGKASLPLAPLGDSAAARRLFIARSGARLWLETARS